ncbi:hypothetical protein ABID96_001131 [Bacillus sp. OAE603]
MVSPFKDLDLLIVLEKVYRGHQKVVDFRYLRV